MQCRSNLNKYPVRVERTLSLESIPSGSGLAVVGESVFVVGDDSPWLFELNKDLKLLNRHLLLKGFPLEERIPKPQKPDFEAMAEVEEEGRTSLLIFGSGSKSPERDVLVKIDVKQLSPRVFSLTGFYEYLLSKSGGTRSAFNIEGAVVIDHRLFLFNRGDNSIFVVDWKSLMEFLEKEGESHVIEVRQYKIKLPEREGLIAGFSGACSLPGNKKILFTATLEATENWIDDGEIIGSYIGVLDVDRLYEGKVGQVALVIDSEGKPIADKLESVAFLSVQQKGHFRILAVADNDDGTTRFLELRIDNSLMEEANQK